MVVRAAEFFSGLGGMHFAIKLARVPETAVVAAYDINQVANDVYAANHGLTPTTVGIDHLDAAHFARLAADLWTLSPPCQPYTRGGLFLDDADPRTAGLLHLIGMLARLDAPPRMLILENVLGFERSRSRARLLQVLVRRGYVFQEFLVAPSDPVVAIPNERLRYYLVAWRANDSPPCDVDTSDEALAAVPLAALVTKLADAMHEHRGGPTPSLEEFLGPLLTACNADDSLAVPAELLASMGDFCHDIVRPCDTRCSTFTRAYASRYIRGVGSLLQTRMLDCAPTADYATNDLHMLPQLGLRFFAPAEIARLHGLDAPGEAQPSLVFPAHVSRIQQYRLLGNSLNVRVVSALIEHMFREAGVTE